MPHRPRTALLAASLLLAGVGRARDVPTAPPPRPVVRPLPVAPAPHAVAHTLPVAPLPRLKSEPTPAARGEFDRLADEWLARKGAVEVAYRRFRARADELAEARQRLAALREPGAKTVPPVLRAADVDAAIKTAEQLAEYRAGRLRQLEAVAASAAALVARADEFDRAAAALHRQRDATLAALQTKSGAAPGALAPKQLDAGARRAKELGAEVAAARATAEADRPARAAALEEARAAAARATARLEELRRTRDATLAAFAFEERVRALDAGALADEFDRLRLLLAENRAALKGDADDYANATAAAAGARAKLAAWKEPPPAPAAAPDAPLPPLERAARELLDARGELAARVRAIGVREEGAKALAAALDELERRAVAYSATLGSVRRAAAQLAAVAAEVERRVGRGDLDPAKAPDGGAEAAGKPAERAEWEREAAAVGEAVAKLRRERDALRRPDPEADGVKSLTLALLGHVAQRLDLLAELKKLAAEAARAERPEAERRRLDQLAADRMAREAAKWDVLLSLHRSKPAADLSDLLTAYYRELVALDERRANLERQKELLNRLAELTRKEAADAAKLRAMLARRAGKSGAARGWDGWLAARLAPAGLRAEGEVYREQSAKLDLSLRENARRVAALAGGPGEQEGSPARGLIPEAREALFEARARGLAVTGAKVALVLLGALVLPRLAASVLRRRMPGGASPALSAVRAALKLGAWLAASAIILNVLGYDVTALVVALAVGALAAALAARPLVADLTGALVISAERRFAVGDVVRLGEGEPARVVGFTWRSTTLKDAAGLVVSVPNRAVAESRVENRSRGGEAYDALAVTVSTDRDAARVIQAVRTAVAQCKNVGPESGVVVVSYAQRGPVKVVQYRFWWFVKDFESRNRTRDEVIARVAMGLAQEDMTGIEVALG